MLMGQSQDDRHQYYCKTMNLSLLPHAKIMLKVLMREAIIANNVSGISSVFWYGSQLNFDNEEQLCFHSILTQRYFHNTLRTDKNSNLSSILQKIISESDKNKCYDKKDIVDC